MLCDEESLAGVLASLGRPDGDDLGAIDALLTRFPTDPRLHFLKGSVLAGLGRAIEAHQALSYAVSLAPDFAIARFQLGFFELTSGEPDRARATWLPLASLPDDHHLRLFVTGLEALIEDRFADAIAWLERGMAVNSENPPLNRDMQMLIDECRRLAGTAAPTADAAAATTADPLPEPASATSFVLGQFGRRQ